MRMVVGFIENFSLELCEKDLCEKSCVNVFPKGTYYKGPAINAACGEAATKNTSRKAAANKLNHAAAIARSSCRWAGDSVVSQAQKPVETLVVS